MAKSLKVASVFQQSFDVIGKVWPYALPGLAVSLAVQWLAAVSTEQIALICFTLLAASAAGLVAQVMYTRAVFSSLDRKKLAFSKLSANLSSPILRLVASGFLVGAIVAIPAWLFAILFVAAAYQLSENVFLLCAGAAALAAIPVWFYLSTLFIFTYSAIIYKDKGIRAAFAEAKDLVGRNTGQLAKIFALTSLPLMVLSVLIPWRIPNSQAVWLVVSSVLAILIQTIWLVLYHQLRTKK
jgi:hypothetical protein